jgi:hypothetical protein
MGEPAVGSPLTRRFVRLPFKPGSSVEPDGFHRVTRIVGGQHRACTIWRFADWQTVEASVEVFQFQVCRRTLVVWAMSGGKNQRLQKMGAPTLPPLRPVGNAELYRSGVVGRRCQVRRAHRSSIPRRDHEGCEFAHASSSCRALDGLRAT